MKGFLLVDESKKILEDKSTPLKKSLRIFQKYIIERTGYRISKVDLNRSERQIDLRHITTNPIEAVYRAGHSLTSSPSKWVIINVPMDCLMRFPMGFGMNSPYPDPFAETVKNYLNGLNVCYEGSALEKYFNVWQPKNAAELLGLDFDEANEALLKAPAFGAVCPWDFDSPEERTQMNNNGDWRSSGPITQDIGQTEFLRFGHIAESIVHNGYHRNTSFVNGDIGAQVLVRGSEWRILICDGTHRFATLRALGWQNIPVSLRRWPMIIRREDVHSWPNVVNLLFSVNSALKIFDLFFDAKQPSKYKGYEAGIKI